MNHTVSPSTNQFLYLPSLPTPSVSPWSIIICNNISIIHNIIHFNFFKKSRNLISMSDIAASEGLNENKKNLLLYNRIKLTISRGGR